MRILIIAPPWFPVPPTGYGGIEAVVALLADGLVAAGHDVTLLASGDSATAARQWSVHPVAPSRRIGDVQIELAHVLEGYRWAGLFDVIHDHSGLIGPALGSMTDVPVVHTLHGPWTDDNLAVYRRLAPPVSLVAISHDQGTRTPADVDISAIIHNAVDLNLHRFEPVKKDHLLFVGRANREKGPEVAIEVARRLDRPLVMALKINEPQEHRYFDEVVKPQLNGHDVEVLDRVTPAEKVELMGHARTVLFPIQWPEPFGLVPVEANACGTPVAAFANGAAPEVIAHGRSGYLAEPGDLDGLCAATEAAAMLDPYECRAHVEENFSPIHMVRRHLRLYLQCTGRRRPSAPSLAP